MGKDTEFRSYRDLEVREVIRRLFDEDGGPFLVVVDFPRMGTSPDWFLLRDIEDLEAILDRVSDKVEISISNVWDLVNPKGEIRLRK